jgi:hypothetical protein
MTPTTKAPTKALEINGQSIDIGQIINLIAQYGPVTIGAVTDVIAAIKKGLGVVDPTAAIADLTALVNDALTAKAEADLAATGLDPQD